MSPGRFGPGRSATLAAVAAKVRAKRPLWRREGQPSVGRHRAGLAGLAMCLMPVASLAAGAAQPEAQGQWACHSISTLNGYSQEIGDLTLNNLRLRAKPGRFSNVSTAELSFTVINRSQEKAFTTFQVALYDGADAMPSIVFSLEPSFGIFSEDTTKQLAARVNVQPGEVERVTRFCIRADG